MGALPYRMPGFRRITEDWSRKELDNLRFLLAGAKPAAGASRDDLTAAIEYELHWNYHSGLLGAKGTEPSVDYQEVVARVAAACKLRFESASVEQLEVAIADYVLARALVGMKPGERHAALHQVHDVHFPGMVSGDEQRVLGRAAGVFGGLGLAQASGFGVYQLATTSLGFLTHAMGVTLPFAVYTGMTSTIAVAIGPVGWLGAGWLFSWQLAKGAKTRRLTAAVMYVMTAREARASHRLAGASLEEILVASQAQVVRLTDEVGTAEAEAKRQRRRADELNRRVRGLRETLKQRSIILGALLGIAVIALATLYFSRLPPPSGGAIGGMSGSGIELPSSTSETGSQKMEGSGPKPGRKITGHTVAGGQQEDHEKQEEPVGRTSGPGSKAVTEGTSATTSDTLTPPVHRGQSEANGVEERDTDQLARDDRIAEAARRFLLDSGTYREVDVNDAVEQGTTTSGNWAIVWLRMPDASEIAVLLKQDQKTQEWISRASGPPFEKVTLAGAPAEIRSALR